MSITQSPNFLRYALIADAIASGATGLLVLAGSSLLGPLLNIPEAWLLGAGLILVPYVAFVVFVAMRPIIPRHRARNMKPAGKSSSKAIATMR